MEREKLHLDCMRFPFNAFFFLRSTRTPKPVPDVKQSSRHISVLCVNTSRAQTKIHITAQNVVSAGRWNDIHDEIPSFLFVSWYSCFPKSKAVIGLLQYQVLPNKWKEHSCPSPGREQRLIRKRDALNDTHVKITISSVFSSVFAKS